MKITYDWLKDHLKTNQTEGKLLEQLTNVGLEVEGIESFQYLLPCLLYSSPSPRDQRGSRMPSSA